MTNIGNAIYFPAEKGMKQISCKPIWYVGSGRELEEERLDLRLDNTTASRTTYYPYHEFLKSNLDFVQAVIQHSTLSFGDDSTSILFGDLSFEFQNRTKKLRV